MDPPEDRQEEHSSADLMDVVGLIWGICSLLPASLGSQIICGFKAALDDDEHTSSSYHLFVGDYLSDILTDMDGDISPATSGMCSKQVSKPLPYPRVCSRKYYEFEGEEVSQSPVLPHPITDLDGIKSFLTVLTLSCPYDGSPVILNLLPSRPYDGSTVFPKKFFFFFFFF